MNIWPTATLFFNATDAWNKQTDAAIQLLQLAIPPFLSVCLSVRLSVTKFWMGISREQKADGYPLVSKQSDFQWLLGFSKS